MERLLASHSLRQVPTILTETVAINIVCKPIQLRMTGVNTSVTLGSTTTNRPVPIVLGNF